MKAGSPMNPLSAFFIETPPGGPRSPRPVFFSPAPKCFFISTINGMKTTSNVFVFAVATKKIHNVSTINSIVIAFLYSIQP
ncbi:MAG: hypothetical protein IKN52_05285 [Victivallales bacterium]|nr:hypothetical protein [Victivallales bacterium]